MHVAMVNLAAGRLSGGFRKYVRFLVPQLRADPRVARLDVFVPPSERPDLAAVLGELQSWPEADAGSGFPALRRTLASLRPDVVFIPTARRLGLGTVPQVVMLHNMEPLEEPLAGHTPLASLRNLARAFVARRACRQAARVIAPSRHVAEVLERRWGIPSRRLAMIPPGVEEPAEGEGRPPAAASALEGRPFLFTAGSLRPARGLDDALDALARAPGLPPLLVAGAADPDTTRFVLRLRDEVVRRSLGGRIIFAGQLGEEEMRWSFTKAAAFVTTSRTEACPNIGLEALAHGALVVSTDQPPMPEVFGGAARYYPARSGADLARALATAVWATPEDPATAREAARARARHFSWEDTGRRVVDLLEEVFRGS
jgi:glycosyltransferase involved in cell wall biosynthesis